MLVAVLCISVALWGTATADGLPMGWLFPDGEGADGPWGVRCVPAPLGRFCRAHTHLLFTATPALASASLVGGSELSIDGGPYLPGPVATYETHLIPPTNRSQVWTMDWDAMLYPSPAADFSPPSEVCIRAWSADTAQDSGAVGLLEPHCMNLTVTLSPPNGDLKSAGVEGQFFFGNWSVVCYSPSSCQTQGHIAILAAVPDVVTPIAGGGEVRVEDGPWSSEGISVAWLSKFDDNSTVVGIRPGVTYQRLHYAVRVPFSTSAGWQKVCLRAWVQDLSTGASAPVNMTSTRPNRGGVAEGDGVRCWGVGQR